MKWNVKDSYRWRRRFALWPTRVGNRRIWLGEYAWRPLKKAERPHYPLRVATWGWRAYALPDGYACWRLEVWPVYSWHEPEARSVSELDAEGVAHSGK